MSDRRAARTAPISVTAPHAIAHPVMLQRWHDLTALHWRYPEHVVQALLPDGFVADTFDGSAWVGLIPFRMQRIRIPGLPAFGPLSTFPETNVRTYIIDRAGRRGVWFFSLDCARLVPAMVARTTYRLPYCWSAMTVTGEGMGEGATRSYVSRRRWPKVEANSSVTIEVGALLEGARFDELDHFLTARWALGTTLGRRLMWANVEHPAWSLHAAAVRELDQSLLETAGLPPPSGDPLVRWSPGVDVRIQAPRPICDRPRQRIATTPQS